MRLRALWLAVAATLMCAADFPEPSEQLKPYIKEGRFDPGDYEWMRGRFDDAPNERKDEYIRLNSWVSECLAAAKAKLKADLATAGFANPAIDTVPVGPVLCRQVAIQPSLGATTSFADFQTALARVEPIADTYLAATKLAASIGGPRGPGLGDALAARPLAEQMLRFAFSWGTENLPSVPQLAPDEKAILDSRIGVAMAAADHENTEWLKKIVQDQGWPKISVVGPTAANEAWLLVQHADADPLFQLQALQLMEPLLASGEVSRQNYAFLYDRVMLKLTGKQRYGTQAAECRSGKREPQPLEDAGAVEGLRKEAGLPSLAEYFGQLDQFFGPCPK